MKEICMKIFRFYYIKYCIIVLLYYCINYDINLHSRNIIELQFFIYNQLLVTMI